MVCGEYEIRREGEDIIARVNCEECPFFPSLEDEPRLMGITMNILIEAGTITKLIFIQKRDVEYDYEQVQLLTEPICIVKLKLIVALIMAFTLVIVPSSVIVALIVIFAVLTKELPSNGIIFSTFG